MQVEMLLPTGLVAPQSVLLSQYYQYKNNKNYYANLLVLPLVCNLWWTGRQGCSGRSILVTSVDCSNCYFRPLLTTVKTEGLNETSMHVN